MKSSERGEEVEYGFLGVALEPGGQPNRTGVQIASVIRGSPAHKAGLQPGDRLVEVGGNLVHDYDELFLAVSLQLAGSKITLKLGSSQKDVEVTLAKYYLPDKIIATNMPEPVGGLRVDYTEHPDPTRLGRHRCLRQCARSVAIREVRPGSAAGTAKLEVDTIITRVNNRPVNTPAEFYREMHNSGRQTQLTIVHSGGQTNTVTLDLH